MRTVLILQARTGSVRFPKKIFSKIGKRTLLEIEILRLKKIKLVDKIVIATTNKKEDKKICDIASKLKVDFFQGDENNVLKRYYDAAKKFNAHIILRVTGDCPLIDFKIITKNLKKFKISKYDYLSNTINPTYPDGLDFEIFSFKTLSKAFKLAKNDFDKEHVTPFIKRNRTLFKIKNIEHKKNLSDIRLTIDYRKDLNVIKKVFKAYNNNNYITLESIEKIINSSKEIFMGNNNFIRDETKYKSKGQKLWQVAKKIIPGGNMLLSKRPEMFLPDVWPTYYSKASGCYVWDLNNNKFIDFCLMGVGTNLLGYSNKKINNFVIKNIKDSNVSTLNSKNDVILAKKLLNIHPWAEKIKFAKTGGEANSIAVRIARSFTKTEKIAFSGYHGWHDWYLASNLQSRKNLNNHLLKNLQPSGVPNSLRNTSFPFEFNNFESLKKLIVKEKIKIIKMEISRYEKPKIKFLKDVRKFCDTKKIILIFDECTSGFRTQFGGLHLKYNIKPDLAIFGKALGNGFPITAVVGKGKIMDSAQDTFISSTFWTENIGTAAAIKTLEIMKKTKSWLIIQKKEKYISKAITNLSKKNNLKTSISCLNGIIKFDIKSKIENNYKTFITQEMLKKRILATNLIYVSTSHSEKIIKKYLLNLNSIFKKIRLIEKEKKPISLFLNSDEAHNEYRKIY